MKDQYGPDKSKWRTDSGFNPYINSHELHLLFDNNASDFNFQSPNPASLGGSCAESTPD